MNICANLQNIRQQIADTANRCGRDPAEIQLVAVSKRKPVEDIQEAVSCGQMVFGENYIQEAVEKIPRFANNVSFHFIGHLQSNKVKEAVKFFDLIETVDRLKILSKIDTYAKQSATMQEILVQVNVGREKQKSGIYPEHLQEFLKSTREFKHICLRGLMTMPPFAQNPELTRPYFRELRTLKENPAIQKYFNKDKPILLSMGMSNDFIVAIEEGANLIRVGTAIFGLRDN